MNGLMSLNSICGEGLSFTIDGFRAIYVLIAIFMWAMTLLMSPEYLKHYKNKSRYYIFFAITFFALIGVFLSSTLFTTFIFFEIMSFTSYVWVAFDERKESLRAASTYLAVAVIGGLVMLMGLFLLTNGGYNKYLTCGLIFFGFAAKAGVYPLHIWLPKAHPVAPAPASALLSGILTKSGIYGILILSFQMMLGDINWGTAMLIFGVITMFLGAVLALFSIDLKRTLACSSVSQIGFIMVGVGIGTMLAHHGAIAMRGTMLHMVNHSLFKLCLFMAAGVVFMNLHKLDLNEIRGFGRNKTLLKVVFASGALGIGCIPLFSGYVSKTLLHEGILEYIELVEEGHVEGALLGVGVMKGIEWLFIFSGGCTVAYMIKLFMAVFVEKNKDAKVQAEYDEKKTTYMGTKTRIALALSAVAFPVMGILPGMTMDKLADLGSPFMNAELLEHSVDYFAFSNLKGGLMSIAIGALVYICIIKNFMMKDGEYVDRWPSKVDIENAIYRPLLLKVLPAVGIFFARICDSLVDGTVVILRKTLYSDRRIPREYVEGNAVTHAIGDRLDKIHYGLTKEDREPSHSYEHRLARWYKSMNENQNIISRSLSFGLVLASMGLLFTLVYLLSFLF